MRDSEGFENAAALLPQDIRARALELDTQSRMRAEEFRLRTGRPPTILSRGVELPLAARAVTAKDLDALLEAATRASAHTAFSNVAGGFVTVRGGCRVGLCGEVSESAGRVLTIRRLSSVALRIPRECRGCADKVFPELMRGGFSDTLLISPPGAGKTTLLRELVRKLSATMRIALLDERGEVAGVWDGAPELDVGEHTDVLTGADKRSGAAMLIRSMNPQVLAMDEITAPEDVEAIRLACGCGVTILASAHARTVEDLRRRPLYRELLSLGIFRRCLEIGPLHTYSLREAGL